MMTYYDDTLKKKKIHALLTEKHPQMHKWF